VGEGESGRKSGRRDRPLAPSPPHPLSRLRGEEKVKASPALEAPILFWHLTAIALALVPPLFFGFAVAPAAFRILPTRDMAASLTSPILTKACWLAEGSFVLLLGTSLLLARWWNAPRLSRSLATRAAILGLIASLVVEKLLIPPIDKIREEAPGLIDNLPAADPSRILLARYHRLSLAFFAIAMAAAIVILASTVRWIARRNPTAPVPAARPPVPKLLDLSDL
jgi:hypothetical protein